MRSRRCLLCSHCLDGVVGRDDPFGTGTADCVSGAGGSVAQCCTWFETHDYIGYLHDILGYFCILKGGEP